MPLFEPPAMTCPKLADLSTRAPAMPSTHSPPHPTPLRFLMPGWFAIVMGLSGLSMAWFRAEGLMGSVAVDVARALGVVAALVFGVLLALSLLRMRRYPQALREDLQHPVRHAFVSTVPVALILLATVAVNLMGPSDLARVPWMVGSAAQFAVTVWVLSRWLKEGKGEGFSWPAMTPVLLIAIVGNVVPALAGPALGQPEWAAAQFGIGAVFWPVLVVLLVVRIGVQGMWPARLLPSTFITVAPPSVIGLGVFQLGAPVVLAWMCWGVALFFVVWASLVCQRMLAQPFALAFWSLSFPLAAFSGLTLALCAHAGGAFALLAMALLALTSLVVAWLALSTVKGLRDGSLLAPEPVAAIVPAPPVSAPS